VRLAERHGDRVWRIGLDGGFPCPRRAGGRGAGGCAFCSPRAALAPYQGAPLGDLGEPGGKAALASLAAQVRAGSAFLSRRYGAKLFMLYFQAYTSTDAPEAAIRASVDASIEALEAARPGSLRGLVVSTRPDCFDEGKARLLAEYAAGGLELWVELGLQSANEATLARMRRGHGVAEFLSARRVAGDAGLRTAAHLILGLPGEGRPEMLSTVGLVAALGLEGVKFHDLHLARGSALAAEYPAGELTLIHPARLPPLLADCLERLPPACEVMRLCSDAGSGERLAPRRPVDKARLYRAVEAELGARGSRQGSLFYEAGARGA
jgi:radical SAM protein (TIGR01212 family)